MEELVLANVEEDDLSPEALGALATAAGGNDGEATFSDQIDDAANNFDVERNIMLQDLQQLFHNQSSTE